MISKIYMLPFQGYFILIENNDLSKRDNLLIGQYLVSGNQ